VVEGRGERLSPKETLERRDPGRGSARGRGGRRSAETAWKPQGSGDGGPTEPPALCQHRSQGVPAGPRGTARSRQQQEHPQPHLDPSPVGTGSAKPARPDAGGFSIAAIGRARAGLVPTARVSPGAFVLYLPSPIKLCLSLAKSFLYFSHLPSQFSLHPAVGEQVAGGGSSAGWGQAARVWAQQGGTQGGFGQDLGSASGLC